MRKLVISLLTLCSGILVLGCSLFAQKPFQKSALAYHNAFAHSIMYSNDDDRSHGKFLTQTPPSKQNDFRANSWSLVGLDRFSAKPARYGFEAKYQILQRPNPNVSFGSAHPPLGITAFVPKEGRVNYKRASLIGMVNAGAILFGFKHAIRTWGKSNGRFHLKDDWNGDQLAQADELSHLMWGYKMTQFLFAAYRWSGFSSKTSQVLSISQSAFILTLVEYPLDAYNPKQGFGISDLIFDYLGVGLAIMRKHQSWLEDFDFKISLKRNSFSTDHPLFAQTYEEYDNFVYWLTYRTKLVLPRKIFCFGLGYGTTHQGIKRQREFYWGVGVSVSDFASLFGKKLKERAKFLDLFYPNLRLKLKQG